MTENDDELQEPGRSGAGSATSSHPEQEHPEQEAHGGSMAPGLVDDTGRPVEDSEPGAPAE